LSYFEALRAHCSFARLSGLVQVAESSAFAFTFPDIVVFSAPPTRLEHDDRGRLHSGDGAAIAFADGWALYYWHGVSVPARIILEPESIRPDEITGEPNAEVRRSMLERYGTERLIRDLGAKRTQADDYGALYRVEFEEDEALVMVQLENSTPEPDGSFKEYWLRVPPTITTAREAVAWTFGLEREQDYAPAIET
jgi:hypothetical protein